jgi:hypothetical protein
MAFDRAKAFLEEGEAGWLSVWSVCLPGEGREGQQPARPGWQQESRASSSRNTVQQEKRSERRRGAAQVSSVQPGLSQERLLADLAAHQALASQCARCLAVRRESQTRNPPLNSRYRERGPGWLGCHRVHSVFRRVDEPPPVGAGHPTAHAHARPPLTAKQQPVRATKSRAPPSQGSWAVALLCSGLVACRPPAAARRAQCEQCKQPRASRGAPC